MEGIVNNKNKIFNRANLYKLTDKRVEHNVLIKLIGYALMFIGELGDIYKPSPVYAMLKYISFMIFADCLIIGFKNTSNLPKYFVRLWIYGLVAQIPFTLLKDSMSLNILFTYIAGLMCMYFVNKKESYLAIYVFLAVQFIVPLAYSNYYLSLIVMLFVSRDDMLKKLFYGIIISVIFIGFNKALIYAILYHAVGLFVLEKLKKVDSNIIMDNIKLYNVYPAILTILFILKMITI